MKTDRISFTSKINFVDGKTFEKFYRGKYIDFRPENNFSNPQKFHWPWFKKSLRNDIIKADEFYTDNVRTCTAGGVIDSNTGQCAGFHIYDSYDNAVDADKLLEAIFTLVPNPERAMILGSKRLSFANYSLPVFEEILEGLKSKIKNITIFREHIFPYSETHFHYSLKKDTWTIRSLFRYPTDLMYDREVLDSKALHECFKEIKIANNDKLNFVV